MRPHSQTITLTSTSVGLVAERAGIEHVARLQRNKRALDIAVELGESTLRTKAAFPQARAGGE